MHPDLLLNPGSKPAGLEDGSHLLQASEQVPASHEPPNAFRARRGRQAAIVRPVFIDPAHFFEHRLNSQLERLFSLRLVPVDHGSGKLLDESGVASSGFEADANYGSWVAFGVGVHEMKLGSGAVGGHSMLGRRVDVPSRQVDCGIVESEAGVSGVIAFFMRDCEGWAESPVVEVAFPRSAIVEGRFVGKCWAVRGTQGNWHLMGASMAHLIVCEAVISSLCETVLIQCSVPGLRLPQSYEDAYSQSLFSPASARFLICALG